VTELNSEMLTGIYENRFAPAVRDARSRMWETLCRYWMQRYVPRDATVLDLAAGQCEFINHIQCARKIAVDLNEDVKRFANPDVRIVIAWSHDIQGVEDNAVDVVFVSNFFEHLPSKQALLDTLREIRRVLKPGGRLLILRYLAGAYWDFIDHYLPLTDRSLTEALRLISFDVQEVKPRFLPYTTRSVLPKTPLFVRAYLKIGLAHYIFGRQAWVVASKPT
jgi:ubiquinone/menaquinone biosynthesis C-methylase UbiE